MASPKPVTYTRSRRTPVRLPLPGSDEFLEVFVNHVDASGNRTLTTYVIVPPGVSLELNAPGQAATEGS